MLGLVTRVWIASLRVRSTAHPLLGAVRDRGWVLAHWHGQILPLLAYRRRGPSVALVSLSADGDKMASALRVLDMLTVRGSSSNGGRAGLAAVVKAVTEGADAVIAVDGPKGPRHVVKAGALAAAERTGGVVVPFAAWCSKAWVVRGSWDGFEIPLPFSRVGIALGAPLEAGGRAGRLEPAEVGAAIETAVVDARRAAGQGRNRRRHHTLTEEA